MQWAVYHYMRVERKRIPWIDAYFPLLASPKNASKRRFRRAAKLVFCSVIAFQSNSFPYRQQLSPALPVKGDLSLSWMELSLSALTYDEEATEKTAANSKIYQAPRTTFPTKWRFFWFMAGAGIGR